MRQPLKLSRVGWSTVASRRQKWIDQAQSLNLYINNASGKKLDVTYRMAWYSGLKTTYYLRSLAATGTEKSTVDTGNQCRLDRRNTLSQRQCHKPARWTIPTVKPVNKGEL